MRISIACVLYLWEKLARETGNIEMEATSKEEGFEEEGGAHEAAGGLEDSRSPDAPDVTYDATVLEQNQSEAASGSGGGEEGGREEREKAVRFKEEVAVEETGRLGEGVRGETEREEEWLDILGSGDLKKKVSFYNLCVCVCI